MGIGEGGVQTVNRGLWAVGVRAEAVLECIAAMKPLCAERGK